MQHYYEDRPQRLKIHQEFFFTSWINHIARAQRQHRGTFIATFSVLFVSVSHSLLIYSCLYFSTLICLYLMGSHLISLLISPCFLIFSPLMKQPTFWKGQNILNCLHCIPLQYSPSKKLQKKCTSSGKCCLNSIFPHIAIQNRYQQGYTFQVKKKYIYILSFLIYLQ